MKVGNILIMAPETSMLRTRQVLGSPRRVELLAHLRRINVPVTVQEAADVLGLHPNTARIHLEQLLEVGLVEVMTERRREPGRPRALFRATKRTPADIERTSGENDYRVLASVLAQGLAATSDPAGAALAAGSSWIEALGEHEWPARPATVEVAAAELTLLLDRLGFEPDMDLAAGELTLRRCPFADVARANSEVVCGVHLGMVQRALDRLDSPLRAERIEPFVSDDPLVCRIMLITDDLGTSHSMIRLPVLTSPKTRQITPKGNAGRRGAPSPHPD